MSKSRSTCVPGSLSVLLNQAFFAFLVYCFYTFSSDHHPSALLSKHSFAWLFLYPTKYKAATEMLCLEFEPFLFLQESLSSFTFPLEMNCINSFHLFHTTVISVIFHAQEHTWFFPYFRGRIFVRDLDL